MSWYAECEDCDFPTGPCVAMKELNVREPDQQSIFEDSRIKPHINPNVCLVEQMNGDHKDRAVFKTKKLHY